MAIPNTINTIVSYITSDNGSIYNEAKDTDILTNNYMTDNE